MPENQQTHCPALRHDLNWVQHPAMHRWIVNEPFSNLYYYLSDKEKDVATLLDGTRSPEQIVDLLEKRWGERGANLIWLEQIIRRFAKWNLLQPLGFRTADAYQSSYKSWPSWLQWLKNPLAIRFPLFKLRSHWWFFKTLAYGVFHPILAVTGCLVFAWISLMVLQRMLHQPEQLFFNIQQMQGDRWIGMFAALVVVKSIHEFGHYLACLRWGVACPELGVMLLCFSPCFYCDTTDAWKLPSRWQRAAIGAAGIYMELWISVFAGCVYLNSNSGFSQTLAAGIWLMCTVGTLVLNGNPCFRYDGYYILSDITNTPNLTLQSSQSLWSLFIQTLGGRKVDASAFDQKVSVLAAFAFVSGLYRWSVLVLLIIFLWRWLTPNGLGLIFVAISTAISLGLILQVRRFIWSLASEFFTKQPISPIRTVGLVACLFGSALAVVFLPIPQRARLRGFVERIDSVPIYAPEAGVLEKVSMDSKISSGELILKLRNSQLEYDLLTIEQEIELLEIRESILEKSRAQQDQVDYELPTIREYHRELELKKALMQKEFDKLTLIASTDDVELTYAESSIGHPKGGYSPQPIREDQTTQDYVLTPRNLGVAVERGTLMGRINAPSGLTVRGFISENHLKEVQSEYPDATFLNRSLSLEGIAINDAFSGRWVLGGLTRVARDPVERVPQELMHDAQIATQSTSGGELQFESPHYPVEFQIKDSPQSWIRGDLVSVYLTLPSKTIVEIMWDAVQDAIRIQR